MTLLAEAIPPHSTETADEAGVTRAEMWAVRPEVLPIIGALRRGQLRGEEREHLERQAARRPTARSAGVVAILTLRGLITPRGSFLSLLFGGGSGGLEGFRENFREALADSDVGAILVDVDSPGGLLDLVPETAAEIRSARGTKPIVAIANTMAASAAYWIGAQADELIVTPSGEVGSIGVFTAHEDWSKFDEQLGVKTTLIAAGKYKTEGNPYEPLGDQAREAIQGMVDDAYDLFVADVAAGRGVSESAVRAGFGEGRMLTPQNAVAEGMVDAAETIEETIGRLISGDRLGGRTAGPPSRRSETDPTPDPEPDPAPDPEPPVEPPTEPPVEPPADPLPDPTPDPLPDPTPDPAPDPAPDPEAQSAEDRRRVAEVLLG